METPDTLFLRFCDVRHAAESWPAQAVRYTAGRLGVVLLSSGQCSLRCTDGEAAPPAAGGPGSLFIAPVPFALEPLGPCHCLTAVLEGEAARAFADCCAGAQVQDVGFYPAAAGLLLALADPQNPPPARRRSALGYELLCLLEPRAPEATGWPPLVQQAVALIRERYGSLYGVEELADQLGVSKSHLVRVFGQALGTTPGRYLTDTRIEAARQLLGRGYALEVVATLCGFSGANYLCKVFKRETGQTPAQYRRSLPGGAAPQPLADAAEADLFL